MKRRIGAAILGAAGALTPLLAAAQEHGGGEAFEAHSRASDGGADWATVMLVTVLSVGGLLLLTTIGYLYRRQRGLDWAFQKPDVPQDDHH